MGGQDSEGKDAVAKISPKPSEIIFAIIIAGWWLNQPIWKILVKLIQIGNLPQVGVKIKNIWNYHLDSLFVI